MTTEAIRTRKGNWSSALALTAVLYGLGMFNGYMIHKNLGIVFRIDWGQERMVDMAKVPPPPSPQELAMQGVKP